MIRPTITRRRVDTLIRTARRNDLKAREAIRDLQRACKHPIASLRECDYKSNSFFKSDPPRRVCLDCGLAEDGWGCGYQKLGQNTYGIPVIKRDMLYELTLYHHLDKPEPREELDY